MRTLPCYVALLAICWCACKQQSTTTAAIKEEPDYLKGKSFLDVNNDSAFYYFNKVATTSKDSLQVARAYNDMSVVQATAGDYFGSQESLLTSISYLDEHNDSDLYCLSSNYNELGTTNLNLKNFNAAIDYYNLAIQWMPDSTYKRIILNCKALAYQKKHEYNQAIDIFLSIINQNLKDKSEYARILSNLAKTRWLQNPNYNAAPDLLTALKIREAEKDDWGLNASYAHLSDYYANTHPDSALLYAQKMHQMTLRLKSPDDELEALQKLIVFSAPPQAKQYFLRYQFLEDSVETARNAAKNQFALIRYETEKSKADNLRLQKENAEKQTRITKQRQVIFIIVLLVISAAAITVIWYKKRKQFMKLENEKTIQDNLLRTSQKVHDVVANGLYGLMAEIEHIGINKEQLLDRVEYLYERSRDISYEKPDRQNRNFQEAVTQLLESFATNDIQVLIVGNDIQLWDKVHTETRMEIAYMLQELMVNMKKHSQAQHVIVKFEQEGNVIKIHYTDDGVGLPADIAPGNGLTSTGNRITRINGQLIFEKPANGTKIKLTFPLT